MEKQHHASPETPGARETGRAPWALPPSRVTAAIVLADGGNGEAQAPSGATTGSHVQVAAG